MSCSKCQRMRAAIARAVPIATPAMQRLANLERAMDARKKVNAERTQLAEVVNGRK